MGEYADNNVYLSIDGVAITAPFKDVSMDVKNAGQDTTMGSGTDWMQRAPGLNDMSGTITIGYDTTTVQAIIQHIAVGQVVTMEYGKEGNTSGKPRHVQPILINNVNVADKVDKTPSTFVISFDSADAPSVNMYAGGVY